MKKAYSTPDIFFDSFALSENIASVNTNCAHNVTTQYSNICGLWYGETIVFTIAATGCEYPIQDGSPYFDGLCYHIPTDDNRLFNS